MRTIHPNTTITNYPFGMRTKTTNFQFGSFRSPEKHDSGLMPGRTYSSEAYGYGFNGMQKDDEISGSGNNLDFGARIYDSRLGRWMSVDPLQMKYLSFSPYFGIGNNPIIYNDIDGREIRLKFQSPEAQKAYELKVNESLGVMYKIEMIAIKDAHGYNYKVKIVSTGISSALNAKQAAFYKEYKKVVDDKKNNE